jgi:class 3 adenylate cyclase/tetratricopeptide (TPR) repeat protein
MTEIEQLQTAILELEAKRALLGDAVVEAALDSMRARIEELKDTQTSASEQLKYVTVLFTDMTGSTQMVSRLDPEDLRDIIGNGLQRFKGHVDSHEGSVLRFLGDGFMAIFGVPRAKEDDAEQAVRAGLGILEAARNYAKLVEERWGIPGFNVRVGINTGRVIVGGELVDDNLALGLAIHIAQRMESAAPTGGLLIAHSTYLHVRGLFKVQRQPLLKVKGRDRPVRTYLVLGEEPQADLSARRGVEGVTTPIIGREEELKQLRQYFQRTVQKSETGLVTVIGEPGVGKSRLLIEFDDWLQDQPDKTIIIHARATPQTERTPYGLLRDAFTRYMDIQDGDSVQMVHQKIEEGLSTHLKEEPHMKSHFIGALLGFDFSDSSFLFGIQSDPQQLRERGQFYLAQFFEECARDSTAVLVVDDIQWGDDASLKFIQSLSQVPQLRLCILGLGRPELLEKQVDWAIDKGIEGTHQVCTHLLPLSGDASQQLLDELLQKVDTVPAELRKIILRDAEGNPYYIEELINILIDDGVIVKGPDADHWHVEMDKLQSLRVPPTLTAVLQARLDSQSEEEKKTLQQASVVGRIFWDTLLGEMSNRQGPPEEVLDVLTDRDLIFPRAVPTFEDTGEYIFKHALMRDVTYESVLKRTRRTYHAKIADWLTTATESCGRAGEYASVIAEHYDHADDYNNASTWYLRAGQHAKAQGAPEEACTFLDRALILNPSNNADRCWLILIERSEVLGILGDPQKRRADDEALLELAHASGDLNKLAKAYYHLGYSLARLGNEEAAVEIYDNAIQAARGARNQKLESQLLSLKVVSLTRLGNIEAASIAADQALTLAVELDDDDTMARTLTNISIYYGVSGDLSEAVQLLRQQVAINHRLGSRTGEAIGWGNMGYNYVQLGLYQIAREALLESIQICDSIGLKREGAYMRLNLALAYYRTADFDRARETLEFAIPELVITGDQYGKAAGLAYFALVQEGIGILEDAEAKFTEANGIFESIGVNNSANDALSGLARCALAQGRLREARELAGKVSSYLEQFGSTGMEFPIWAYLTCAEIFTAIGDPTKSVQSINEGYNELLERADRISDFNWRDSFLHNVPEHDAILTMWQNIDQKTKGTKGGRKGG